jgi:hypothetical protein
MEGGVEVSMVAPCFVVAAVKRRANENAGLVHVSFSISHHFEQ